MLKTRLWMGAMLITLAVGVLVVDQWLAPWCPFLFVLVLGLALVACHELLQLFGPDRQLPGWFCYLATAGLVAAGWLPHIPPCAALEASPWAWIAGVFAGIVLLAFLREMAVFSGPGQSVSRLGLVIFLVAYLGLLSGFFVQLRWLPDPDGVERGTLALALAIFVPKMGDIGAYFTGRLLGRRPMTPLLSPKKTWEGAAGGVIASVLTASAINRLGPVLPGGLVVESAFGITVGVAGMLGDLAESLIKRDCQRKDASGIMPGFGGVLDVVDAILFAGPVAYAWFAVLTAGGSRV